MQTQAEADARAKARAATPRYRSPTHSQYVEVSLDEFSDEEIAAEHAHRTGATVGMLSVESLDEYEQLAALHSIRTLMLCGQDAQALAAMREFCRDVLGTAL